MITNERELSANEIAKIHPVVRSLQLKLPPTGGGQSQPLGLRPPALDNDWPPFGQEIRYHGLKLYLDKIASFLARKLAVTRRDRCVIGVVARCARKAGGPEAIRTSTRTASMSENEKPRIIDKLVQAYNLSANGPARHRVRVAPRGLTPWRRTEYAVKHVLGLGDLEIPSILIEKAPFLDAHHQGHDCQPRCETTHLSDARFQMALDRGDHDLRRRVAPPDS
jgi:hypothetical protein